MAKVEVMVRDNGLAFRNASEAKRVGKEYNNKGRQCTWRLSGEEKKHCPNPVTQVQAIHCDKHLKEIADVRAAQVKNQAEAAAAVEYEIMANRAVELEVPDGRHELLRHVETVIIKVGKDEEVTRQYLTQIQSNVLASTVRWTRGLERMAEPQPLTIAATSLSSPLSLRTRKKRENTRRS
jgi:hypothetical protein